MKQALLCGGLVIFIIIFISVTACPCPAGSHCVNGSNLCQPCVGNKYQKEHNSTAYFCDDCDVSCGQREFVVKECSPINNLVCQCEDGFHKEGLQESVCVPHNACKAGFEEIEPGNHMNNTLCEPCKQGTYRTAESASKTCLPCSECADEEDVVSKCTTSKDTVCRSKTGTVLIIAVCVGVAVLLILAVVIILVCLRRKGYEIPFCKRSEEKRLPSGNGYHLTRSISNESPDSPTKVHRNGARTPSGESNGQLRVKLESTSSMGSGGGTRSRMHSGSTSPAEISSEFQSFILKLSEDLCSIPEWKMFMRSLIGEGSDIFINSAVNDNPNNTQEQIYQVFRKWIRRNPDEASKQYVIDELKRFNLNLIALKYEGVVTDV